MRCFVRSRLSVERLLEECSDFGLDSSGWGFLLGGKIASQDQVGACKRTTIQSTPKSGRKDGR
jgi:hypothetical protein